MSSSALLMSKDLKDDHSEMVVHKNIAHIFTSLKDIQKRSDMRKKPILLPIEFKIQKNCFD